MSSEVFDKTKKALRAVLISAPRGVPIRMMGRDFMSVLGYELPFRQLGFVRMEDFMKTIPDVVRLGANSAGEPTYYAVADEKTSQILRFVTSQKKPKVKKSGAPPMIQKPRTMSGFTKKSHYGPNSRSYGPMSRSRPGGSSNIEVFVGRTSQGGYNKPTGSFQHSYNKRSRRPPAANLYQHPRSRPPLHSSSYMQRNSPQGSSGGGGAYNEYIGSAISARSNNVAGLSGGGSNISSSSNHSGYYSGLTPHNAGGQGSPMMGPRTSGNSTNSSNITTPRGGNYMKQATPEHRGQGSSTGYNTPAASSGKKEYASKLWNSTAFKGKEMTIREISNQVQSKKPLPPNLVTEGYIAGEIRFDKSTMVVKYLLHQGYTSKAKKGVFPAILLTFTRDCWDTESEGVDLKNIVSGSKLKVYGVPFVSTNKKKQPEAGLKVQFYSYEPAGDTPSSRSSSSSLAVGMASSKSTSPSSIQYPPMSGDFPLLIHQLLKEKTSGIWGKRFGKEFETFHKMEAPKDIMERASALPFVETEMVAPDNPILQLKEGCNEFPMGKNDSEEVVEVVSGDELEKNETVGQSVSLTTKKPSLPGVVELKSAEYLDVYVSYINSPTSFYLQNVEEDNAGKLESLVASMGNYFTKNQKKPVKPLEENQLYGYKWVDEDEEEELWCRVLVSNIDASRSGSSSQKAVIYFPDYGNTMAVGVEDLLELPGEYYQLPFQAVHCCLHGCEGAPNDKATQLFVDSAQDKNCVAQVMNSSGTRVSVELISSEGGSDTNTTINSLVMNSLYPIHSLGPKLPKPGESRVPVSLSDVDEDGVLMVQVKGPGRSRLQHLMTLIEFKFQISKAVDFLKMENIKEGDICCGQYSVDHKFYRVRIKKVLKNQSKFLVEFVDYGNEDMLDIKLLRKPLQDELFRLPFQAVPCRLHGIPAGKQWSVSAHHYMASYLDHEDLYLTVVEEGNAEGQLPLVKITAISRQEDGEDEEEVLNEIIPWETNGHIEEEDELSAKMENLSLDLQQGGRSNSGLFVFTGGGGSTQQHHHTTSSAPVTPLTHEPDSIAIRSEIKTPNSASSSLFKFEKLLHDGANVPFKFSFSPESVTHSVTVGSKRAAATDDTSSPRTNPRMDTPITPRESSSASGQFTPSGDSSSVSPFTPSAATNSSSTHVTPSISSSSSGESGQWVKESQPSNSVATERTTVEPAGADESAPITPSKSPSSFASVGGADPWQTPNSSAELGGHKNSLGVRETPAAVVEAKRELVFAKLTQKEKKADPVVVTWVSSPHKFVVQQLSAVEALNNVEKKLNKAVSCSSLPPLSDISPGQLCLAPSSLDDKYYRAMVVQEGSGTEVVVEFLDYGNTEPTDGSKLKSLPSDGREFPFQAITCSLKGTEALSGVWSSEELEWFERYVLENSFFAMEMSREEGISVVAMLDTSSKSQTVDVTEAMKDVFTHR